MIKEETRKVHRKPGRNKGGLRKLWGTPWQPSAEALEDCSETAVGAVGGAVGSAVTSATAGTVIGGAVASGVGTLGAGAAALGALGVLRWLLQSTTEDRLERLKECFKRSD